MYVYLAWYHQMQLIPLPESINPDRPEEIYAAETAILNLNNREKQEKHTNRTAHSRSLTTSCLINAKNLSIQRNKELVSRTRCTSAP
jgi:diketogulonate reductase-like aldo/keto reductase